ncbi:MAG: protein-L-isoaspartate(D-aspartate) O-methyltransferase [Burkholderiaceae bacterium]|nr:protein-L-isoaspartate(D-aspartate) O-methyltransferase [Burkholderiaceae bacterium]
MNRRPGFPARLDLTRGTAQPVRKPLSSAATGTASRAATVQPPVAVPAAIRAGAPGSLAALPASVGMDSSRVRDRMVQRLAAQGVTDALVLQALAAVERHRFVDTALVNQAYEDTSLPIGLGQTISKPGVVARMLSLLRQGSPGKLGRVLDIGTGCGYQAAVLSHLATEVYSIERLRGLHEKARNNLRAFRLANVHLLFGDGMEGFAKGAPYAGIIAAAGGEAVPQAWLDQLAVGGRLVAPLVTASGQQALVVVDKSAQGLRQTVLEAVHFVPLKSGIA